MKRNPIEHCSDIDLQIRVLNEEREIGSMSGLRSMTIGYKRQAQRRNSKHELPEVAGFPNAGNTVYPDP
jgi:hypothetical protein